ncbi:MAG: 7-carboxy-7-deazaguanine synthase QueE [Proteobacteria bacterium]|nr:7-carboxy-7-deazaguanine synthase QueE [Pseudomonadota bacterium]NCA28410.1 7-carboxy-7-deazaguanine synthase QueE [Pseudomonadota bacterium]
MFGNNKILAPVVHDGDFLEVQEIFQTLQGEGNFVGQPAVFIRLGGCNLACKFCDTEFDNLEKISLENILQKISDLSLNHLNQRVRNLVVITGGEPFRQPIEKLCDRLIDANFLVQIETNGTLFRNLNDKVKIICSPKATAKNIVNCIDQSTNSSLTQTQQYHQIRPDLLARITSFKFIISAHQASYSSVPQVGQDRYQTTVFVQPMDEYDDQKNRENLQLAIKLCQENGYFLSLQTHKIVGLR